MSISILYLRGFGIHPATPFHPATLAASLATVAAWKISVSFGRSLPAISARWCSANISPLSLAASEIGEGWDFPSMSP